MKKPGKMIGAGMLLVSAALIAKHYLADLPDFVYGLLMGTGVGLELFGLFSTGHDMSKFKKFKETLFRKGG